MPADYRPHNCGCIGHAAVAVAASCRVASSDFVDFDRHFAVDCTVGSVAVAAVVVLAACTCWDYYHTFLNRAQIEKRSLLAGLIVIDVLTSR